MNNARNTNHMLQLLQPAIGSCRTMECFGRLSATAGTSNTARAWFRNVTAMAGATMVTAGLSNPLIKTNRKDTGSLVQNRPVWMVCAGQSNKDDNRRLCHSMAGNNSGPVRTDLNDVCCSERLEAALKSLKACPQNDSYWQTINSPIVQLVRLLSPAVAVDQPGNFIISPLSLAYPLTLLACGAGGDTRTEMAHLLGGGKPGDLIQSLAGLQQLGQSLAGSDQIKMVNAVYVCNDFPLRPEFNNLQNGSLTSFGKTDGHIRSIFESRSDLSTNTFMDHINRLTCESTGGMIDSLLSEPLPAPALMAILNALHFQGHWQNTASKTTMDFRDGDQQVHHNIPAVMVNNVNYRQCKIQGQDWAVAWSPYSGNQYGLLLAMPVGNEGAANLNAPEVYEQVSKAIFTEAVGRRVTAVFPGFRLASAWQLRGPLQKARLLQKAFDPAEADFSQLSASATKGSAFHIGNIIHKASVNVDEYGTEASAATLVLTERCAPQTHSFDKPFKAFIVNQKTKTPCFEISISQKPEPPAERNQNS
ncbi:serpin family protein [Endozoicomonas sp. SCSIO W0465]|uniref:serpin family protein n=1 Tax=Endozoicomonas sp. SCSIO W0465 TaxID=2918516 RepID=UPI002075E1B9|nr:serpin family protein [Endozoicomonas sp. SCSIO W0465]USE37396.1 hypothetical protein MJO57_03975 [Endozoicomonas sp. SCSIO W0465]